MLLLGLLYALFACQRQLDQQISTPLNTTLTAYVDDLPRADPHKISFIGVDNQTGQRHLMSAFINNDSNWPVFKAGELYRFNLRLKPPHGTANGVGFDRERWLFRHGIDGLASIQHAELISQHSTHPKHWMHRWRDHLGTQLDQAFTSQRVNGLIRALSIGDKANITAADYRLLQNTGTAHLIAISGLHIGMVASLGWLLGWLWFQCFPHSQHNRPKVQVLIGVSLALTYAILAGLSVATQRALVMLLIYALFKLRRRNAYAWDVWSCSLLVVLLLDPLHVLDGGFWLSFVAVAVLILAFQGAPRPTSKMLNYLKMQWVLLLGMMPLNLSVFGSLKLAAPLVNFVLIPLLTLFVVPALLLLLLIGSVFNEWPAYLVSYLQQTAAGFLWLLDQFNAYTATALDFSQLSFSRLLLLSLACLILVLPRAVPQRHWAWLLLIFALIPTTKPINTGHFKAEFLDVGQGLSVLINTQQHRLLYDVGATYPSGFNMADAVVIPYLRAQGIQHLDRLILSHRDNDHSGAWLPLTQQIQVNNIYSTESLHNSCEVGLSWIWDGVQFDVLSPYNNMPYLKNNSSCVLKISGNTTSLLLTGDIESAVEYRLRQHQAKAIQADVMLVPHHGSNTSSTTAFIQQVKPQIAINSSGQYNPFGHPKGDVLARYQQQGVVVYDTQNSGKITLMTEPELQIDAFRRSQPRIWRQKKPD